MKNPLTLSKLDLAQRIAKSHQLVIQGIEQAKFFALYTGALLQYQKEALPHGKYLPFVKKCKIHRATANRYVNFAASILPKCRTVRHLPLPEIIEKLPELADDPTFQREFREALDGRGIVQIAQATDALPAPVSQSQQAEEAIAQARAQGLPPRTAAASVWAGRLWEQLTFLDEHVDHLDEPTTTRIASTCGHTLVKLGYDKAKLLAAGIPIEFSA